MQFSCFQSKMFWKIWTAKFLRTLGNLVQNITYLSLGRAQEHLAIFILSPLLACTHTPCIDMDVFRDVYTSFLDRRTEFVLAHTL